MKELSFEVFSTGLRQHRHIRKIGHLPSNYNSR